MQISLRGLGVETRPEVTLTAEEIEGKAIESLRALASYNDHYIMLGGLIGAEVFRRFEVSGIDPSKGEMLREAQTVLDGWRRKSRVELKDSITAKELIGAYVADLLAKQAGMVLPPSWGGTRRIVQKCITVDSTTLDGSWKSKEAIADARAVEGKTQGKVFDYFKAPTKPKDHARSFRATVKRMLTQHGYSLDQLSKLTQAAYDALESDEDDSEDSEAA